MSTAMVNIAEQISNYLTICKLLEYSITYNTYDSILSRRKIWQIKQAQLLINYNINKNNNNSSINSSNNNNKSMSNNNRSNNSSRNSYVTLLLHNITNQSIHHSSNDEYIKEIIANYNTYRKDNIHNNINSINNIHYVTFASDNNDGLQNLLFSALIAGIDIHVTLILYT